jgi:glycosyltransferase involved in cell wall biosynthesis
VTCNHAQYIDDCLESAWGQVDGLGGEIVVGDDCSDDATSMRVADWALRHPGRIRHFRHAARLGAAANGRFVVAQARGDWIALLDGDDMWLPGKLRAQLAFLQSNNACPAVYTNAIVLDADGRFRGLFNNDQTELISIESLLERGNFLNLSSVMFRREHVDTITSIEGAFIDYRLHLQFARRGVLGYINRPGVLYRANSATSMVATDNANVRELYWQAIDALTGDAGLREAVLSAKGDFLRRVLFRAVRTRDPALFGAWRQRVMAGEPQARPRVAWAMMRSVASTALAMALEAVGLRLMRSPARIWYRH